MRGFTIIMPAGGGGGGFGILRLAGKGTTHDLPRRVIEELYEDVRL